MSRATGTKLFRKLQPRTGILNREYEKRDETLPPDGRRLFKVHEFLPPVLLAPGQSYNVEKALKRAGYKVITKGGNIIRVIKS